MAACCFILFFFISVPVTLAYYIFLRLLYHCKYTKYFCFLLILLVFSISLWHGISFRGIYHIDTKELPEKAVRLMTALSSVFYSRILLSLLSVVSIIALIVGRKGGSGYTRECILIAASLSLSSLFFYFFTGFLTGVCMLLLE